MNTIKKYFNINDSILVKLTEDGKNIWIYETNKYLINAPKSLYLTTEKIEEKKLDNGYWKFQMWDLMQIFGQYLNIGNPKLPFETEIIMLFEIR